MPIAYRNILLGVLGLNSGVLALSQIQVDNAVVGERVIVLMVDDSIQAPDLSKIQIEGYSIENAAFVEEMGPDSTHFSRNYLDLTLPGNGKIVDYIPTPGTMVVDLPATFVPQVGTILADTAFGGVLRKVVSLDGQSSVGNTGRRWVLNTVDADLPEAILDCDVAFKTRVDLNQSLADVAQSQDVVGDLPDGSPAYGQLGFSLKTAQILFQPMVTGRIRIRNGVVELFQVVADGDCEVTANVVGDVSGNGDFNYEEELPGKRPALVPLGSGLFVKIQDRPFFRIEAASKRDSLSVQGSFRIQNSIRGELGFKDEQWRPLAENKMTLAEKSVKDLRGEGEIKISLKPRVEMFLEGVQGPAFTFEPYARFASAPDSSPSAGVSAGGPATGSTAGLANAGAIRDGSGSVPAGSDTAFSPSSPPTVVNRQMSLGSNIYMEMRANFVGPAAMRSFLLFNREQTVLSPPREGALAVREADSNRIALMCQTFPKADYYIIQAKLGAGNWETVLDKAVLPKLKLASLKPNSQYRFRAIGVNAMGSGPAFPPDGMAYNTPSLNRPPLVPVLLSPDSASVVPDSTVMLTWKGGDPDPDAKVVYTVLVDAHSPPLAVQYTGTADTSLELTGLTPGQTYFWKIVASDGIDRTESPIRSFTLILPPKPDPGKERTEAPLALVPKGTYLRQDGNLVLVGPFFLGKTEVTQADFQKLSGKNPSYHINDSLPVERVTWEEAEDYCQEIGGRLPTEAEWEYAARAGSTATFYWGDENPGDYAWYRDNSDNHTQKVGLKKPNAWGLHDMAGNVFEWVEDWYGDYSPTELDHPRGPASGTAKVIRGASWYSESANLSMAARYSNRPGFRNFKVGFRCAKDVESAMSGGSDQPVKPVAASTAP